VPEAGLWGLAAASTLVVGAGAALVVHVPRRLVALVMGIGSGALISALAFDLTSEAFDRGGTMAVAVGLAGGALVFFIGDRLIERRRLRHPDTATPSADEPQTSGTAIVLGALLDGIPESVVLGSTLLGGAGVGVSFLAAVALSNLPEGMGAAADLRQEGHSPRWILGLWVGIALVSGAAAAIGYGGLGAMGGSAAVALIQAFAAGAMLAMLADTMIPEAFSSGGDQVGLATVLGFAAAFLLSRVS
jgi:ZIP family zinc transporter